jgi:hypothetical protein
MSVTENIDRQFAKLVLTRFVAFTVSVLPLTPAALAFL